MLHIGCVLHKVVSKQYSYLAAVLENLQLERIHPSETRPPCSDQLMSVQFRHQGDFVHNT